MAEGVSPFVNYTQGRFFLGLINQRPQRNAAVPLINLAIQSVSLNP